MVALLAEAVLVQAHRQISQNLIIQIAAGMIVKYQAVG